MSDLDTPPGAAPPGATPPEVAPRQVAPPGVAPAEVAPPEVASPRLRRGWHFSLIWLIPLVALVLAVYLGWRNQAERGPEITLTFLSADGLTAGQTKVRHKAVDLGTVRSINLSRDMSHVVVRVEMRREATRVLTDRARFWVVRPRLTPGNISGLETIVSGSYIELDPGQPDSKPQRRFTGLEEPPAVRSDEPGRTFSLHAARLGSLGSGSPIFYHDVTVGEVLGYDAGAPGDPVTVHAFVRDPYAQYVHDGSFFWNASGLSVEAGANGLKLQLESIQAVLAGGIAFDTPEEERGSPAAADGAAFTLYADQGTAEASQYRERISFLIHFKGSVRGLGVGAPVELYGIQIGNVTDISLHFDRSTDTPDVPVRIEVEPERIVRSGTPPKPEEVIDTVREMVRRGLRAQLRSANLLTGQLTLALDFFPAAPPAEVSMEGQDIVLPSEPTDLENVTRALSDISQKLQRMPLDEIAQNLNNTLAAVDKIANGAELKNALESMAATMSSAQDLVRKVDAGITPALRRLPDIAAQLDSTLDRANKLVGSVNGGYGENSEFRRDLERLLSQVADTARSVRLLADFLDEHPEALIRGRTGAARER